MPHHIDGEADGYVKSRVMIGVDLLSKVNTILVPTRKCISLYPLFLVLVLTFMTGGGSIAWVNFLNKDIVSGRLTLNLGLQIIIGPSS